MGDLEQNRWFVLVLGVIAVIGVLVITGINGCGAADRYGKVSVPGEGALELDEGTYSVYYQEHADLDEDETLQPPGGIKIRVRGLGGTPDPELDLGGLSNQIDVNGKVSVSIGKLRGRADGRFGMIVGPSPRPADRPAIALGETFGETARHAVKPLLIALIATGGLFAALTGVARRRRGQAP